MKAAFIPALLTALGFLAFSGSAGQTAPQGVAPVPELKSVSGHPMQYYVVRPEGWTRDRTWPIVIALEAAEKEFKANAERFARARGKQPFIIVTPITVTNGNQGQRDPAVYPYSSATWDRIEKEGVCAFDEDGLARAFEKLGLVG